MIKIIDIFWYSILFIVAVFLTIDTISFMVSTIIILLNKIKDLMKGNHRK